MARISTLASTIETLGTSHCWFTDNFASSGMMDETASTQPILVLGWIVISLSVLLIAGMFIMQAFLLEELGLFLIFLAHLATHAAHLAEKTLVFL